MDFKDFKTSQIVYKARNNLNLGSNQLEYNF